LEASNLSIDLKVDGVMFHQTTFNAIERSTFNTSG